MKPLVYVAGPYTTPDPVLNVRRACVVADALDQAGAAVFVPHLSMLWHLTSPAGIDEWYRRDLDVLDHCNAIVRFHGESVGADREVERAHELGIEHWSLGRGNDGLLGVSLPRWIRDFHALSRRTPSRESALATSRPFGPGEIGPTP